jgi:oligopeptide transport system substrate-binding protein
MCTVFCDAPFAFLKQTVQLTGSKVAKPFLLIALCGRLLRGLAILYPCSMRRILLLPTVFLLALGTLCFVLSAVDKAPARNRPIVFCMLDDIKTLDVGKMSWANDLRAAMALWEGLAVYDTRQPVLVPIPGAAQFWDISPDRATYTFHLRPDARWSNGDPVTAADFLFAWRRVLTPSTGSDYISLFNVIEGAEDYTAALEAYDKALKQYDQQNTGATDRLPAPTPPDPAMFRVEKSDDHTLVVHLKAPCSYFLDLLTMPPLAPLHEPSMRRFLSNPKNPLEGYDPAFTRPPHLVTNGAYQLTGWKFKQYLQLEPNPFYWDRANVTCDQLQMKAVPDGRTALLMLQEGTVDVLSFVPPEFADIMLQQQAQQHQWPEIHYSGVFGNYYYIFNCTRKPFDDKRVRKALAMAIDRDEIVRMLGTGQVAMGLFVPPNSINGYISPKPLEYDVSAARELLARAGYRDGRGLKTIELLYNTESINHSRIAQAIGQMWQRNLGVSVSYRALERGSFGTARRTDRDFDIARGGWDGDYPDPTTWLDLLRTHNGNNDGQFSSKAYDDMMAQSDLEPDAVKRFQLLQKAEDLLLHDEVPFIPLYQRADGFMYDARKIAGANMNVRMLTELKWIRRQSPAP